MLSPQKYEISIVQRIESVLLRAGHISDQENSREKASFNAPQDKRVIIVGAAKRPDPKFIENGVLCIGQAEII